jgi:hypothetical protein
MKDSDIWVLLDKDGHLKMQRLSTIRAVSEKFIRDMYITHGTFSSCSSVMSDLIEKKDINKEASV